MRFRPKDKIRRFVRSKGSDLIVFYPGGEYHGEVLPNGIIISDSGKYGEIHKLEEKEIDILEFL